MIRNYLIVALRNLSRNRAFSAINIVGLSVGISASLVIFLIVAYDFGFDKFENNRANIYRVVEKYTLKVSGKNYGSAVTPDPLGKAVHDEITGLETVAALRPGSPAKVTVQGGKSGEKAVFANQENIVFTTPDYFKLVGYNWLAGSPTAALTQPYQVVLSQSNANLYFPGLNAAQVVGKEVFFDDSVRTTVVGVVADIAQNTVFNYKIFLSRPTLETARMMPRFWDRWNHAEASQVYVRLLPGTTVANINRQIAQMFAKYNAPNVAGDPEERTFNLQPLADVHFTGYYQDNAVLADKTVLYSLLAVAAFLLLLACINFINLTTAQASQRVKEIGIRKTMGSSRAQLVLQFMGETFLLVVAATVISIAFTPMLLKAFATFIPKGVQFNLLQQPGIALFLASLVVTVSLLAGFYPALVSSAFKPVLALKNQAYSGTSQTRSAWLRKGLTVSQFVIAQVFIIGTLLVSKQIHYMLNKNIGLKKDAVISFNLYDGSVDKKALLMNKLKAIPGVAMASLSMDPPTTGGVWIDAMTYENNKKQIKTDVQVKIGDSNYIKLYQIKLLAGANISNNDTMGNLLINETYLHALGYTNPQDIIGQTIDVYGKKRVVGVVRDFNQKSLHEAIMPLLITGGTASENTVNVALQPQNTDGTAWQNTIAQMQQARQQVYPGKPIDYMFVDDIVAQYYTAEQNVSTLLIWSAGLTIFISCLGLLGLVIYVTNQRTKEIGIRKVVGATVMQLVTLLSTDFLKLVITAFAIAVPLAWWGANIWQQGFAYKTALSWWVFAAGGALMLLLAFVILSIRTVRAANANPVLALKNE